MPENPALWHTEKYGVRDLAAQAFKMLVLDALHGLGRPATFLDVAEWVLRTEPRHLADMRGYVWTFGQECALRADSPLYDTRATFMTKVRVEGEEGRDYPRLPSRYADWPQDGTWEEQFRYTVTERLQWYMETMLRNDQLVTEGYAKQDQSTLTGGAPCRLILLTGTRKGLKLYARGPQPLKVDRFRVRTASKEYTYDPAIPDWWELHAKARADLREMIAASKSAERVAQLQNIRRVLHQIEHFFDAEIPMREDDI